MERHYHTTFLTSDLRPVIATCGGTTVGRRILASCLVLDQSKNRWDERSMGDLTMGRYFHAAATLNSLGVYNIGGGTAINQWTSNFLPAQSMQWQEGPVLPVGMSAPCAVTISPTSFLVIYDYDIREFDADIAGPISIEGWRDERRWPKLETRRKKPGCAKIGQKVIIAGGYYPGDLRSTEVLDLDSHVLSAGEDMGSPRSWFHLATIRRGGVEKVFAVAGSSYLNTVEVWLDENATWEKADSFLAKRREEIGAVAVPEELICSA